MPSFSLQYFVILNFLSRDNFVQCCSLCPWPVGSYRRQRGLLGRRILLLHAQKKKKKEDTAPAKVVGEIGGAMNKAGLGLNHFSNKDIRPSLSLLLRPPANRPHLHFCLGKKSLQTDR